MRKSMKLSLLRAGKRTVHLHLTKGQCYAVVLGSEEGLLQRKTFIQWGLEVFGQ